MWLLAGLGNPGDEYKNHRHNIGFMAIDEIAGKYGFPTFRSKYQSHMAEGTIAGQKVLLMKPQTYMNNSGQAIAAAAKFYKIDPSKIVVFHDELDLDASKIRTKLGGGNAGHNGLRSMQAHLATPDFWRVRMGIGHPGDKARVHGYVLSDFAKAEHDWLKPLLKSSADNIDYIIKGDMDGFMNKVALDVPAPKKLKNQE